MGAGHLCASLLPQPPAGPSAHRGPPPGFLCYPIGVSQGCDDALRSAATRRDALTAIISYRRRHYCCECFCSKSPFWLPSRIIGLTPPPPFPCWSSRLRGPPSPWSAPAAPRPRGLAGSADKSTRAAARRPRISESNAARGWSGGAVERAEFVFAAGKQAAAQPPRNTYACRPAGYSAMSAAPPAGG